MQPCLFAVMDGAHTVFLGWLVPACLVQSISYHQDATIDEGFGEPVVLLILQCDLSIPMQDGVMQIDR